MVVQMAEHLVDSMVDLMAESKAVKMALYLVDSKVASKAS
jgi:hypothetical protein